MRLSAFILECLVVLMILAPCQDHQCFSCPEGKAQVVHAGTQQNSWADNDCSPLCTCSCCAAVSLFFYAPVVESITDILPVRKYSVYISPFCSSERSAVWQPPRIG